MFLEALEKNFTAPGGLLNVLNPLRVGSYDSSGISEDIGDETISKRLNEEKLWNPRAPERVWTPSNVGTLLRTMDREPKRSGASSSTARLPGGYTPS